MSTIEDERKAFLNNPYFTGHIYGSYTPFYITIAICTVVLGSIIILNIVLGCCSKHRKYWQDRHTGNRWLVSIWSSTPHKQPPLDFTELKDASYFDRFHVSCWPILYWYCINDTLSFAAHNTSTSFPWERLHTNWRTRTCTSLTSSATPTTPRGSFPATPKAARRIRRVTEARKRYLSHGFILSISRRCCFGVVRYWRHHRYVAMGSAFVRATPPRSPRQLWYAWKNIRAWD